MSQASQQPVGGASLPSSEVPFDLGAALRRARLASRLVPALDRPAVLRRVAEAVLAAEYELLAANAGDVASAEAAGTSAALVDRLRLDAKRLHAVVDGLRHVADLPDPLGRVLQGRRLPNGLELRQITVPFGVIGMVYESRPNVTVDAFALGFMAGSAVVLRGSADALGSNRALVAVMRGALAASGAPADALTLIDDPDRARVSELLRARGLVDLVIPRGGAGLIRHVVETAQVPVIETGVGNCHLYLHAAGDPAMALDLLVDGKLRRQGTCNALETLLVDRAQAADFLPKAAAVLLEQGVSLHACERSLALLEEAGTAGAGAGLLPATEEDWRTEYLGPEIAVRVVDDLEAAIEHVNAYGSQHSEVIVTRERAAARRFQAEVDAAVVLVNASSRFTDGFEFGLGAEIGISTQKLHARGPMGLEAMVTSKYLLDGEGQTRG